MSQRGGVSSRECTRVGTSHYQASVVEAAMRRGFRAQEVGRKDSFDVGRNDELRILVNFRDFLGKYVMHCHNLIHEDHAMMARFDIVPEGQV